MKRPTFRHHIVNLVSVALISLGSTPISHAGFVGTNTLLETETQAESLRQIDTFLARQEVRDELLRFGVSTEAVSARVRHLTPVEIQELQQSIDAQIAGGDALGLIGAVFVVLLLLELLGVTNVFSAF